MSEPKRGNPVFGWLNRGVAQLLAYLLILAVTAYVFTDARNDRERQARQDQAEIVRQAEEEFSRCEAGAANRASQIDTIQAVYSLGITLLTPSEAKETPQLTEFEKEMRDRNKQNLEEFRSKAISRIKTSENCRALGFTDRGEYNP